MSHLHSRRPLSWSTPLRLPYRARLPLYFYFSRSRAVLSLSFIERCFVCKRLYRFVRLHQSSGNSFGSCQLLIALDALLV